MQFSFCPIKQQGAGRAIKISSTVRSKVLKKIPQTTLIDLRDRAIFAVLAQRALPLGALVNVKVGDYNQQTGVLTVSKRASAKPIRVKLRRSVQQVLAQYLASAGAPSNVTAPLFISSATAATTTHLQSAVCVSEIKKMAQLRAKAAKVVIAGITSTKRK
jgi:site-specific recombinase XerC